MRHWADDPQLRDTNSDGETVWPIVQSRDFAGIGSWEEERALLISLIRHLVLEVREVFERVAEHDDDHFHHRI